MPCRRATGHSHHPWRTDGGDNFDWWVTFFCPASQGAPMLTPEAGVGSRKRTWNTDRRDALSRGGGMGRGLCGGAPGRGCVHRTVYSYAGHGRAVRGMGVLEAWSTRDHRAWAQVDVPATAPRCTNRSALGYRFGWGLELRLARSEGEGRQCISLPFCAPRRGRSRHQLCQPSTSLPGQSCVVLRRHVRAAAAIVRARNACSVSRPSGGSTAAAS